MYAVQILHAVSTEGSPLFMVPSQAWPFTESQLHELASVSYSEDEITGPLFSLGRNCQTKGQPSNATMCTSN